jgi:hypothetical protein
MRGGIAIRPFHGFVLLVLGIAAVWAAIPTL